MKLKHIAMLGIGFIAVGMGALIGVGQNITDSLEKQVIPDTLTGFTQHLCKVRGGEWKRSPQYGYLCRTEQTNGRFVVGETWHQFYYQVQDHNSGLMHVEMMRMRYSPDDLRQLHNDRVKVADGYFIHRGGNYHE